MNPRKRMLQELLAPGPAEGPINGTAPADAGPRPGDPGGGSGGGEFGRLGERRVDRGLGLEELLGDAAGGGDERVGHESLLARGASRRAGCSNLKASVGVGPRARPQKTAL